MSQYVPFVYSGIILVVGLVGFVSGFRALQRKRLIEDTPTSTTRALAIGPAEISGAAYPVPGRDTIAPLTGDKCGYATWQVEEERGSGKHRHWVTIDKGDTGIFLIRDAEGSVLVDPLGAELDVEIPTIATSGFGRDPPEPIQRYLRSKGLAFEGGFGMNKTMKFKQMVLSIGGPAYAIGGAEKDERAKKLFDAGVTATDLVIAKPGSTTFIVSDTERDAERRLSGKSWGGILLGGLAAIVGFGMLLHDLGMGL